MADDEESERKAAYIAEELGYENIFILSGGLNRFREEILNFKMPETISTRQEADTYRFREKASKVIPEILKANKEKGTQEKKESKRVLGGC
jgi:3-mercaptopyruvate sulfurtransferase SseA